MHALPAGANENRDAHSDSDEEGEPSSQPTKFKLTDCERKFYALKGLKVGVSYLDPEHPTQAEISLYKSLLPRCISQGGDSVDLRLMGRLWAQEVRAGVVAGAANSRIMNPESDMIRAVTPLILENFRDREQRRDHARRTFEVIKDTDAEIRQVSAISCALFLFSPHAVYSF